MKDSNNVFENNQRWNERYQQDGYYYGRDANDFLKSMAALFTPGKNVLCLAEGEGRNAVFIAKQGCQVTAIDFSPVGLEKLKKLAAENSVTIDTTCANLRHYEMGQNKWDVIVSIWCHLPSELRRIVHARVPEALKPNGYFLLEAYTPDQIGKKTGGPIELDRVMTAGALKVELSGLKVIELKETERQISEGVGHNGMSSVVQMLAQKARD